MDTVDVSRGDLLARVRNARVRQGELALWYIGAAGYIVRSHQATLLIDPFLGPSDPPSWLRCVPPPFEPERLNEIGRLDAVLFSHEHSDHTDPVAVRAVAAVPGTPVYGPPSSIEAARGFGYPADLSHVLNAGESLTIGDLRITAETMLDPMAQGANGYLIDTGDVTMLHCGDSLYFEAFAELGQRRTIDAICLSVGHNPPGHTYYMTEVDAARAARDANAATLIPQHFDLWQGFTLDPQRVRTAARWYCPDTQVQPARFGQRISIATRPENAPA